MHGMEDEKVFMESLIAKFADEKDELETKVKHTCDNDQTTMCLYRVDK